MVSEPEGNGLDRTQSFKVITRGMTISHYKIERKIGAGGMGEVYLAEDTKLHRNVALKFLPAEFTADPEVKSRFMREAQAAAALNHPNIITVYEVSEHQNRSYIAMEYIEGESLREVIEGKDLRISQVIDFGMQISQGLAKAHEAGIVHRDVKPENVLIDKDGRARILDFGLAKLRGDVKLTQAGSTLGTISYMSPEQAQGEEVDRRSDVFSLGVILYEMIAGRVPFKGEHQAAILNSIITEQPQPVARYNNRVSQELERIVTKALAKDKEERYQHADDLLADLRHEHKISESTKTAQISTQFVTPKPKSRLLSYLVPASIVFVILLVFLILRPFKFGIGPEKGAVAQENTLAIMYFENLKDKEDQERIGEMISELLITGLSESQYMRVISSQRLYDILRMMGREGARVIDKTVASEVAQKADAKYMILGKILATKPDLIVTSQLVDVQTGNVVASQRVAGPDGTDMFSLVDSLSSEIRRDLPVPALAKKVEEKPVADITTHSPEALRLYLEGNELYRKLYAKEAARKFEAAVKIDTTFASAHLRLAFCYSNLGDVVRARTSAEKAARFSDKVSKKEKFLIDAIHQMFQMRFQEAKQTLEEMVELYPDEKIAHENLAVANRIMMNYEEAIAGYSKVIELDSLAKDAYNSLAYVYDDADRYDEAIQSIDKYIQLAPGEANPYDSRGDIYAHHAEVDKAIESYKKALEIKPDFEISIEKLGLMHLHKREYDKAERYFLQYGELGEKTAKSISRADLALIPLSQGKYDLALKVLGQGIAADELDKLHLQQVQKYEQMAHIHVERKEFGRALQYGQRMVTLVAEVYPEILPVVKPLYGYFLAKAGELDSAQKISNEVCEALKDKSDTEKSLWYFLRFMIKYAGGDMDQALKEIGEQAEREKNDLKIRYWLAVTYLESDMIGEAVQEFERLSNWNILSRARNPLLSSRIPYFLGVCYEKSGWEKRAIEKYEEFLEIWKDADPGIPEVEDAEQRLKALKVQS